MFLKVRKKQRSIYFLCYIIIGLSELIAKFSHQTGKLQFLVLPSFFALVMPLYALRRRFKMPSFYVGLDWTVEEDGWVFFCSDIWAKNESGVPLDPSLI